MRGITIIESPYAGDIQRNETYLTRAMRDSFERGEVPFASHGLFPRFLDEENREERKIGIEFGYRFWEIARNIVFYEDYGRSDGMARAVQRAIDMNLKWEVRRIGPNP